jgi:hypothetical protein
MDRKWGPCKRCNFTTTTPEARNTTAVYHNCPVPGKVGTVEVRPLPKGEVVGGEE